MVERLFTRDDYTIIVEMIKERRLFDKVFKFKEFSLRVNLEKSDYSAWKDGMYVGVEINSKYSGCGQGYQLDEFPTYKELCRKINEYVNRDKDEVQEDNGFEQMTIEDFLGGERC